MPLPTIHMAETGDSMRAGCWLVVMRKDGSASMVFQGDDKATERPTTQFERLIAELCEEIARLRKQSPAAPGAP